MSQAGSLGGGSSPPTPSTPSLQIGVDNLGITYSGGTFSITSADGSALSGSNPAYVTLPSTTAGEIVQIEITANQTFIDDTGASTIIGNLFGTSTGISWDFEMPFFIYAVVNDSLNAISFMISRIPHAQVAPGAANIGKTGSAVASTQGSFFALANPTVTDYENNPCICIGSFRMTKSASDDWTVASLALTDGIGLYQEAKTFIFPPNQFGAAVDTYFIETGGDTAPVYSNYSSIFYTIDKIGRVNFYFSINSAFLATAGAGSNNLTLVSPYVYGSFTREYVVTNFSNATSLLAVFATKNETPGSSWTFQVTSAVANNLMLTNGDFSLASTANMSLQLGYIASLN